MAFLYIVPRFRYLSIIDTQTLVARPAKRKKEQTDLLIQLLPTSQISNIIFLAHSHFPVSSRASGEERDDEYRRDKNNLQRDIEKRAVTFERYNSVSARPSGRVTYSREGEMLIFAMAANYKADTPRYVSLLSPRYTCSRSRIEIKERKKKEKESLVISATARNFAVREKVAPKCIFYFFLSAAE